MEIEYFSKDNIHSVPWEKFIQGEYVRKYFLPFFEQGSSCIKNVKTEIGIIAVENLLIPITKNEEEFENSYVCSPYSHYVSYLKEELYLLNHHVVKQSLSALLSGLGYMFKKGKINKIIYVNNWLLSTNLYEELTSKHIQQIVSFLSKTFPDYTISFRSVHTFFDGQFANLFRQNKAKLIASRSIYLQQIEEDIEKMYPKRIRKRIRQDLKALHESGYEIVDSSSLTIENSERIVELYNMLYVSKYSSYNPQFTESFINNARENQLLTFFALQKEGKIDGVIGYFKRNGMLTTPILGYDTSLPKETGLYRLCTILLYLQAKKEKVMIHRSSGVGDFKKNRGAEKHLEYNAVFYRHLSFHRRIPWYIVSFLANRCAAPLLRKYDF